MSTHLNERETMHKLKAIFDQLSAKDCLTVLSCLQSIAAERDAALRRIDELEARS